MPPDVARISTDFVHGDPIFVKKALAMAFGVGSAKVVIAFDPGSAMAITALGFLMATDFLTTIGFNVLNASVASLNSPSVLDEVPLPRRGNLPRRRQARERGHAALGGVASRELVAERHLLRDRRHRGSRRDRRCCGRARDAREALGLGEVPVTKADWLTQSVPFDVTFWKGDILSACNTIRLTFGSVARVGGFRLLSQRCKVPCFLDGMRPSPTSIAVEDKKVISDGHSESHA